MWEVRCLVRRWGAERCTGAGDLGICSLWLDNGNEWRKFRIVPRLYPLLCESETVAANTVAAINPQSTIRTRYDNSVSAPEATKSRRILSEREAHTKFSESTPHPIIVDTHTIADAVFVDAVFRLARFLLASLCFFVLCSIGLRPAHLLEWGFRASGPK